MFQKHELVLDLFQNHWIGILANVLYLKEEFIHVLLFASMFSLNHCGHLTSVCLEGIVLENSFKLSRQNSYNLQNYCDNEVIYYSSGCSYDHPPYENTPG